MSGFNLKAARESAGLTQLELAAKAGLRPETISRAENGALPSFETRYKLRKALGAAVPLEDAGWQ